MVRIRVILFYIRIIAAFVTIIYLSLRSKTTNSVVQTTVNKSIHNIMKYTVSKHIVLVIVVCPPPNSYGPRDEATVLLKSIIISAKLYKISIITIYLFVENVSRERGYFMKKLHEFGYPFSDFLLNIRFRSAVNAVPQKYRNDFITEADNAKLFRCTNVRFFVQSALPWEDAVLYLDTDIVVHGNLADLWNTWSLMDEEQLVGVGSEYEDGHKLAKFHKNSIFPPPRYLNVGVLLMNLTRMRDFDWELKLLRIWSDYRYTIRGLNDQHVINMLLRYNSYLLYRLPCHYNYMHPHCLLNAPCKTAQNSSNQIIHGAGGWFNMTNAFGNFYYVYKRLNISNLPLNSSKEFRAVVQKSFNNIKHEKSICHDILSQIIK